MRRSSISTACSVTLLCACTSTSSAADTTFVEQGARVKVFPAMEGTEPVIGEAVKLTYDTLVIVPEGNGSAQTFYPGDLRKIELSQGKVKSYTVIGMVSGMAVGAGVGLATAPFCEDEGPCDSDLSAAGVAAKTLGFAAIGGLVGYGLGALLSSSDRWVEAELASSPPVALNVGTKGSVRLAFALRL